MINLRYSSLNMFEVIYIYSQTWFNDKLRVMKEMKSCFESNLKN